MDLFGVITSCIGAIGTIAAIIFGIAAIVRTSKTQHSTDGERNGAVLTELGYIKSGIDDIKRKQEKTDEQVMQLVTRVTAVESSAKQAHHRIDRIENRESKEE